MLLRSSLLSLLLVAAGCHSDGLMASPSGGDGGTGGTRAGDLAVSGPILPGPSTCSHDSCSAGAALTSGCDACVTAICATDTACCATRWSGSCVEEVGSICGVSCGGGGFDAGQPLDAALPSDDDGEPTRRACNPSFGSGLTAVHGRLDGYLVTILPPGSGQRCNGDSDHVHLQVLMGGAVYDIAVNVKDDNGGDVYFLAKNVPLPDGAWSEGWHAGATLGYANTLGVHSTDFAPIAEAPLANEIENELARVNHISIFGTGYNANGAHLIHYNGGSNDGAIVIEPQDATSRMLLFHFVSDQF